MRRLRDPLSTPLSASDSCSIHNQEDDMFEDELNLKMDPTMEEEFEFEVILPENGEESALTEDSPMEAASSSSSSKRPLRIKRLVFGCILLVLLLTIGLAVGLSLRNNRDDYDEVETSETDKFVVEQEPVVVEEEEEDLPPPPPDTPAPVPVLFTAQPAYATPDEMKEYLLEILSQHGPTDDVFDIYVPQGQAFATLLDLELRHPNEPTPEFTVIQRYALLTFYYSTKGPSEWTTKWNVFDVNYCTWHGVKKCHDNGAGEWTVTELQLGNNKLDGTLPNELCLLQDLKTISLPNNLLVGEFPVCMVQQQQLESIVLNNNALEGKVPILGYTYDSITELDVRSNQFSEGLNHMLLPYNKAPKLAVIRLDDNQLTGTVPSSWGSLESLKTLTVTGNPDLSGSVEFCLLHDLEVDCDVIACDCCTNC